MLFDASQRGLTTPLIGLTDQEAGLAQEILACLEAEQCKESAIARTRLSCLRELGAAISRFPALRDHHLLRGEDAARFIAAAAAFARPSRLLHSPVRVTAVRGYLAAKSHAFSLLSLLTRDRADYHLRARRVIFTVICTLMIEDVYCSCLGDLSLPEPVRFRLAGDLIALWDSGVVPRALEHLPALEALWAARDAAPPSFGTMDGMSELARITADLGDDWHSFVVATIANDETRFALEEFLFGISYEEILEVRSRLSRFGVSAVDSGEVRSYLGSNSAYAMVNNGDPRMAYDFYVDRRDAAQARKRINAAGPKKTLEEIYLKHRIVRE